MSETQAYMVIDRKGQRAVFLSYDAALMYAQKVGGYIRELIFKE